MFRCSLFVVRCSSADVRWCLPFLLIAIVCCAWFSLCCCVVAVRLLCLVVAFVGCVVPRSMYFC